MKDMLNKEETSTIQSIAFFEGSNGDKAGNNWGPMLGSP